MWIKSIVDLWRVQTSNKVNTSPLARGSASNAKLDCIKRSAHQRKRETFEDRGKGTSQDGYTQEELVNHCQKVTYDEIERVERDQHISEQAAAEIVDRRKQLAKKTINGYEELLKNNS